MHRIHFNHGVLFRYLCRPTQETEAIHLNSSAGSYLETSVPLTLEEDGYSTTISGQLMNVDATTSMQFHSLFESETIEV